MQRFIFIGNSFLPHESNAFSKQGCFDFGFKMCKISTTFFKITKSVRNSAICEYIVGFLFNKIPELTAIFYLFNPSDVTQALFYSPSKM